MSSGYEVPTKYTECVKSHRVTELEQGQEGQESFATFQQRKSAVPQPSVAAEQICQVSVKMTLRRI